MTITCKVISSPMIYVDYCMCLNWTMLQEAGSHHTSSTKQSMTQTKSSLAPTSSIKPFGVLLCFQIYTWSSSFPSHTISNLSLPGTQGARDLADSSLPPPHPLHKINIFTIVSSPFLWMGRKTTTAFLGALVSLCPFHISKVLVLHLKLPSSLMGASQIAQW